MTLVKKTSAVFIFVLFLPLIIQFNIACKSKPKWREISLLFFDTICDLKIYGEKDQTDLAIAKVREIFTKTEDLFSPQAQNYQSPEIRELFHLAKKIYRDSNGAFDLTVGILAELWGFRTKSYRLPTTEEIVRALAFVGMDKIKETENSLIIPEGFRLDWGGIAKGWGVDQAFSALWKLGIKRGFINAGGDLICWGQNPHNRPWRIGLKHPRRSGFLGVLEISNLAVATSGDYQRYFEINGQRYHHIFNPQTGHPARGKQSVTVIGPQTTLCDALATALFIVTDPEILLAKYPEYGAIIVNEDGSLSFAGKKFPFLCLN